MFMSTQKLLNETAPPTGPLRALSPATTRIPRILFADDAVAARVLMSALLRRMNLKVDVAQDGEEVIGLFQSFRFDLILLDIDMPVMDGVATARRVRELEKGRVRTPIIAVSGYLSETADRMDQRGDFDETVPKPVTLARLWTALAGFLPEGHVCAERSSVLRIARSEAPLVDSAGLREGLAGQAAEISRDALEQAIAELRRLAGNLERAAAGEGSREGVRAAAVDLDRLSAHIGALRLQRSAAVLAGMVLEISADAMRKRSREVVSCALATISEFKKHIAMSA